MNQSITHLSKGPLSQHLEQLKLRGVSLLPQPVGKAGDLQLIGGVITLVNSQWSTQWSSQGTTVVKSVVSNQSRQWSTVSG